MFQDYKVAYLRKHVRVKEARSMSFLRQCVSTVLSQSARTIPHAAAVLDYDVTSLVEYSKGSDAELKKGAEGLTEDRLLKRAVRKNFSAFFVKAISHSLYHTPVMNGFIDYTPMRNGGTFYVAEDVNLSFTVHTKFGVIKPVMRNAHLKPIETVASEMRVLTRKARRTDAEELYIRMAKTYLKTAIGQCDLSGLGALWMLLRALTWKRYQVDPKLKDTPESERLQVEDMLGATCTLANIATALPGHQTVTAIIPPEVFMFGLGDMHLAARVVDGEIVPRYMITMCATMDHRAFDAGEAFPFAKTFRNYLENPELIYEWKEGDPI